MLVPAAAVGDPSRQHSLRQQARFPPAPTQLSPGRTRGFWDTAGGVDSVVQRSCVFGQAGPRPDVSLYLFLAAAAAAATNRLPP